MTLTYIKLELKCKVSYDFPTSFNILIRLLHSESKYLKIVNELKTAYLAVKGNTNSDQNLEFNKIKFQTIKVIDKLKFKDFEPFHVHQVSLYWAFRFLDKIPDFSSKDQLQTKRILCLAANPKDTTALRVYSEMRDIAEGVFHSSRFEFHPVFAARKKEIRKNFYLYKPNIVHFAGHGTDDGSIFIEDDDEKGKAISKEDFVDFIRRYSNDIECIFLNSCYSEIMGKLLKRHVKCVIGLSGKVQEIHARSFSKFFYEGLVINQDHKDMYQRAFEYTENGLLLEGMGEDERPIML